MSPTSSTTSPGNRRWFLLFILALVVGVVGTGGLVLTGLVPLYAPIAVAGAVGIWLCAFRAVSDRRRPVT